MKTSRAKTNKSIKKKKKQKKKTPSPFQTCKLTGTEKLEKNITCRSAKTWQNKREHSSLSGRESSWKWVLLALQFLHIYDLGITEAK